MDIPGVALVTGGASGIGRATCILLAEEGVRGLAIADLSPAAADGVKEECFKVASNPKFNCITIPLDVQNEQSVNSMIETVVRTFDRLDYAVNCAGIGLKKALNDTTMDDWNKMIAVNLTGVFACVKAETQAMLKQEPIESQR
jgi:NAD(P)-dependent dehydrogenase (short-subunit alcohol dehydrogenase family)